MSKTANVYARIEPDVKEQAEKILQELGLNASSAINMFYKQIVLRQGLPFEIRLAGVSPLLNTEDLSEELFEQEIEKGIDDIHNGRSCSAESAFAAVRRKRGL